MEKLFFTAEYSKNRLISNYFSCIDLPSEQSYSQAGRPRKFA